MPSYDFEVDLESLVGAAKGTIETVQLFKDKDVEDLVPEKGDLGSDTVWDAVDEFKERMDWYLREMEATPPAPGYDRVMTPGLEEAEMEVERGAKGIPLHTEVVGWLESICKELNIPLDFREAPTPMP